MITVRQATVAELKAYAADKRWRVETGGITRNGAPLPTTREGRSALKDARDLLRDGELLDINGGILSTMDVTINGVSINVSAAAATTMLQLIGQHVQRAFAVEATLLAAIDAGTITTFAQIEAADWPSNA